MNAITLTELVERGIPEEIGANYYELGILLLEDHYGNKTDAIVAAHKDNPKMIAIKIFQKWINGDGKAPVTWTTLLQVLRDLKMNRLCRDIEKSLCIAACVFL